MTHDWIHFENTTIEGERKENRGQYSSEEFPPIGKSQIARPFMKAEVHYSGNTTTALKIRKITNQLYNVKVDFEIPSCPMFRTTAIIDTGASSCCINKKVIPEEALEPLTQIVLFNGLNSRQQTTHRIKQGSFLTERNKFKIPLIYAFDMRDNNGIKMLIGANFLRSIKGGIRIEGDEITIYKKVTKIKTSNLTEVAEIAELEVSKEEFLEINESIYFNQEGSKKKNGELCKLDIINSDITIKDRPLKHVTPAMEDSFKKHVDSLLEIGAIRLSKNRHITMAMIVNSGTTIDPTTGREIKRKERMVFNYKSLNDNTYKDQYSLPGINTVIKRVGGAKIFFKFDLKSGFHQVAMDEESIPLFQRKMDKFFKGTKSFIAVYIDDILVFSKNEKEHAKHLEKMLKICEDNGLVLSSTKMKIAVLTIDFVGAVIGEGTIKPQPHIIKKIVNFNEEELKTKKGLRSFLGILNYARNHIPELGILLRPLYEKTNAHGDKRLKPSDYELVRKIKEQVQSLPDLEIPPENAYIILETDGCTEGWGGINMKITCEEVMKISNHFQESSQKLSSHMKNQDHCTSITSSKPIKPQSKGINLMHREQSPKTLKFQQQKEAVKAMRSLKPIIQSYKRRVISFVNHHRKPTTTTTTTTTIVIKLPQYFNKKALKNFKNISEKQKELESRVQSCQEKLEAYEELLRKTQSEARKSLQQISTEIQQSKPLTKREVLNLVQEIAEQPKSASTNALVVLRDTRWEDSRQIIGTMEIDLSAGTQLVYMFPDMVLSIDDFHNHIEVAIQTHGYDTWQGGESNLLVTMAMIVNERRNRTLSVQFERYRRTPQPARYSVDQHDREILGNDHLDEDEEHFIGICLQAPQTEHVPYDICFCEDCLNEARILEVEPLNKTKRSNKPKRSKQKPWEKWSTLDDWDDDERSGGKILVLQEQFSQNQQDFLDEYLPQWDDRLAIQKQKLEMEWENPFAAKRAQIINKQEEHAFSTDAESSTSYQPPPDAIIGPAVYPPARQNTQLTYKPNYQFGYPQGRGNAFNEGYGEYHNSQWTLPPAWTKSGVMLVLPTDLPFITLFLSKS
uniref:RNA-directed DNA polymerase n=1 Tax=Tanacetum cinerariifolium TaxID=118510 RepID=A0A6L2MYT8_TANCI|nr:ORFIII-like polyprotein [Tanacetum cinerariifolium]